MIRCTLCNRPITDPKHIQLKMGPVCLKRSKISCDSMASAKNQILTAEKATENLLREILKDTKFSQKVYSVGGFVRDDILGIESKDLDIVVELPNGAQGLGEFLHSRFPQETSKAYQIGAGYPIWHLAFKKDVVINGIAFKTAGAEIDIADTQKELFPDPNTRQRITQYGTIEDDIRRRDFSCNMILRDLTTGEIIDKVNGVQDIRDGILRGHPDVDLDKTFSDDPLRMIRLMRFESKYGWKVPLGVLKKVRKNANRISIVSQERIRDELIKVMEMGKLARSVRFMKVTGLLKHVLPEVQAMDKVLQDKKFHSEGNVFKHSCLVLEHANSNIIAQMSALLHDVGKPGTQIIEGDRIKFHGHELLSTEITETIMKRLKFETADINKVKKVVINHLRAHFSKDWSDKAVRKFMRDAGDELDDILHLSQIDGDSSFGPDMKPVKVGLVDALRKRIAEQQQIPIKKTSVLNGKDVMTLLNLKPGKEVGDAISALKDIEDDYAVNKQEITKEKAEEELLRRFNK
jgi:poly(A) polymerase